MEFKKAEKYRQKLKCAIFGPSGSGKTYSALAIASGMSDKIAVIDTERGSASLYADRFSFDVLELNDFSVNSYMKAINIASKENYGALIIDSLSHAWRFLLDEASKITMSSRSNNSWSSWNKITPIQHQFIDCLLRFNGHLFATMRSKTEWVVNSTENGKLMPTRVGLRPEQGKDIEYEFSILLEMNASHVCEVIKDRTDMYQDQIIEKPGKEFGQSLIEWLQKGKDILFASEDQIIEFKKLCYDLNISDEYTVNKLKKEGFYDLNRVPKETINDWIYRLKDKLPQKQSDIDMNMHNDFINELDSPSSLIV